MRTSDNLLVIQPDERQTYGDIACLVEARDAGGRWGVVIVRSDRGTSGMTHLHRGEPEAFFILEGDIEICGAESVTPIGPGSFVLVPPDTEHTLRVLSEEAIWLAIWPPALDGVLAEVEQARADGRGDPETLTEIRRRHGHEPGRRLPDRAG